VDEYYAIRELGRLVQALIDADADADKALERWEAAIKALAEGWQGIEARRAALSEAAE
jgi:exonuclease VII small subunit